MFRCTALFTRSSLKHSLVYTLVMTSCVALLSSACSRSPLSGSANYNCGEGDRVISVARLFCVYRSERRARPEMSAGDDAMAGTDSIAGMDTMPLAGDDALSPLCPVELPSLYVYDTLYICAAEDSLPLEIIESVVASWSETYFSEDEEDDEDESSSPADQGVDDAGIGVVMLRDAATP